MPSVRERIFKWVESRPAGEKSRKVVHNYKTAEVWNAGQEHFTWYSTGLIVEWMPKLNVWRVKFNDIISKMPHQMTRVHTLANYPPEQLKEAMEFVELTYLLGESNGKFSVR